MEGNDKVLFCRYVSWAMEIWRESLVSGVTTPQAIHAISVITRLCSASTKLCRISKSIWLDSNNEKTVWDTVRENKKEAFRQLEAWIMNDRSKARLNCWFISGDTSFQIAWFLLKDKNRDGDRQGGTERGDDSKGAWATKCFSCHLQIPKYPYSGLKGAGIEVYTWRTLKADNSGLSRHHCHHAMPVMLHLADMGRIG